MDVYTSLKFPNFSQFYLTKKDNEVCPALLEKFKKFLIHYYQAKFLGYFDLYVQKDPMDIDKNTKIFVITNHIAYCHTRFTENCLLIVLWDDKCWGKLEWFNLMLKNDLFQKTFSLKIFRQLIGLHRGKVVSERKQIGSYFIGRMLPYLHPLNKIPILFKKQENFYEGYFYGHTSGYLREYVLYDQKFKSKFNQVLENLSDEKSKFVFNLVVYGKPEAIWRYYFDNITSSPQYLDYIKLEKDSIIIDCGICRGEELPAFLSGRARKIYCVDPAGADKLSEYVKSWCSDYKDQIVFIRKWLYASDIASTTLKEIINGENIKDIDFIKSDIEGAERHMLDDLVNIMEKYRPQLAISIYHTQFNEPRESPVIDVVRIPLRLMQASKDYNFYINFYSYERWEIVLYCIPKEKDV